MTTTASPYKLTVADNGTITLPEAIRQRAGLASGDELILVWVPPDTLIIRKISEVAADDDLFEIAMREFDQALRLAGYESADDVINLTREIKAEQISELQKLQE